MIYSTSAIYAISTFLAAYIAGAKLYFDSYGVRLLNYQILHPNATNSEGIPFIVLCMTDVMEEWKEILRREGAVVVTVESVKTNWWIKTSVMDRSSNYLYCKVNLISPNPTFSNSIQLFSHSPPRYRHPPHIISNPSLHLEPLGPGALLDLTS